MKLYQLDDDELESIIHNLQLFTDTEFIVRTIERKIVNDAYELSQRHKNIFNEESLIRDIDVYDELEKEYQLLLSKFIGPRSSSFNKGKIRVYSAILNLTKIINKMVQDAILRKQQLEEELKELENKPAVTMDELEFRDVRASTLKKQIDQPVFHLVQTYPFIQYSLPDDELSYLEQF